MKGAEWKKAGEVMPRKPTWVFFYHAETLQWYDSLFTGIWGFSSNPAPAVFLQKLRFHHERGLRAVVSECTHAERGGEVNVQQPEKNRTCWTGVCICWRQLSILFQLQTVQWNWGPWWAEPPRPYSDCHHHTVPRVSHTATDCLYITLWAV